MVGYCGESLVSIRVTKRWCFFLRREYVLIIIYASLVECRHASESMQWVAVPLHEGFQYNYNANELFTVVAPKELLNSLDLWLAVVGTRFGAESLKRKVCAM